jgi:hypothetical protein
MFNYTRCKQLYVINFLIFITVEQGVFYRPSFAFINLYYIISWQKKQQLKRA